MLMNNVDDERCVDFLFHDCHFANYQDSFRKNDLLSMILFMYRNNGEIVRKYEFIQVLPQNLLLAVSLYLHGWKSDVRKLFTRHLIGCYGLLKYFSTKQLIENYHIVALTIAHKNQVL